MTDKIAYGGGLFLGEIEHALELLAVIGNGERRRHLIAICVNNQGEPGACVFVFSRLTASTLSLRALLPIYSSFQLSVAQSKVLELSTSKPATTTSSLGSKSGFIIKLVSGEVQLKLETASLDALQSLLNKGISMGNLQSFHGLITIYSNRDTESNHEPTPGNPFITSSFASERSPIAIKAIKEVWTAKELRTRQAEYCRYEDHSWFIGTWNVNGHDPTEPLDQWLLLKNSANPDFYVIGFQELDLSTEAYLLYDATKEMDWSIVLEQSLSKLTDEYVKVVSKQLIGMLILIYVKKSLKGFIKNVTTDSAGTGLLGVMGNKGGVGVRLHFHDSHYCFVNAHLAADTGMNERRNLDFIEISKRLSFGLGDCHEYVDHVKKYPWITRIVDCKGINNQLAGRAGLPMYDADHLIWLGDFNYRIPLPDVEVKEIIKKGVFEKLLKVDQLRTEMAAGRVFLKFQEADITFPPTYKFDVGTDEYDSSEKRRSPSWCDRILWFKNPLKIDDGDWARCIEYKSSGELKLSDHKPVTAVMRLKTRRIGKKEYAKTLQSITEQADSLERESLPILDIKGNPLDFGNVRVLSPITRSISIENKGKVAAHYRFVPRHGMTSISPSWCHISPLYGAIMPGTVHRVNVTLWVDSSSVTALNTGEEKLEDNLVLSIERGPLTLIGIKGTWMNSSLGVSLDLLCRIDRPIREFSCEELEKKMDALQMPRTESVGLSDNGHLKQSLPTTTRRLDAFDGLSPEPPAPSPTSHLFSIPKEIWKLIDFIYRFGMVDAGSLFTAPGDPQTRTYLREFLDRGLNIDLCVLLTYDEDGQKSDPIPDLSERLSALPLIDGIPTPRPRKGRFVTLSSACSTLLAFLGYLPEPVIPYSLYRRCITDGAQSLLLAKQILSLAPPLHYNLFMYLVSFLKELLGITGRDAGQALYLARIFAPLLIRDSSTFIPLSVKPTPNAGSTSSLSETTGSSMSLPFAARLIDGPMTACLGPFEESLFPQPNQQSQRNPPTSQSQNVTQSLESHKPQSSFPIQRSVTEPKSVPFLLHFLNEES